MNSLQISNTFLILFAFILIIQPSKISSQNPSPSQIRTIFRLQKILEYPSSLSNLNNIANICYLPYSKSLSISCYGTRITQLSVLGNSTTPLSSSFSIDSLFTTLSRLPSLTSLSLVSLGIHGPLPDKLHRLSALKVLNLSSNYISGAIPNVISSMTSLESIVLSSNKFNGTVPSLKSLTSLKELDLKGNNLRGDVPSYLFSKPSIQHLDLSKNRFTGAFPGKLSCSKSLEFVDISINFLVGELPSCLSSNSSTRVVLNSWNCLDSKYQHMKSFCSRDPLAAVLPPMKKTQGSKSKTGLILAIIGGVIGSVAVLLLLLFFIMRSKSRKMDFSKSNHVQVKTPVYASPRAAADTRHMSQAVRIGTHGLTPYRVFSMDELEEATNSFDSSNLISDGPQGQCYKGWIRDGSAVVVRGMKLKQKISPQSLSQYTDVISKLRHINLVSILGHCIPNGQDHNGFVNDTIFIVAEHVSNGNLRSHLTDWRKREMLKWPQRVSAVIGVARGIQFLHTVTVPGIFGNDLQIENILLDQTLTAKISNYNLPVLLNNKNKKAGSESPFGKLDNNDNGSYPSMENGEKDDVYQLGLILLEVITGKPNGSEDQLVALKTKLQDCLSDDERGIRLREVTDPTIRGTFAADAMRTLIAVTLNCVAKDHRERPSIDDILWNLQYSVQIQDGWTSSDSLSVHSYQP